MRRPAGPAAASAPVPAVPTSPSQRHARGLVRRRGAVVVAVALLAVVLGTGAGAVVAGPNDIEVFGWRPVGGSGQTGAPDASSQRDDPTGSAKTAATTADPTDRPEPPAEPTSEVPDPTQVAAEVVAATNAQRTAAGLPELAVSSCATEQVTARVAQLVATDAFEHPPLEPVLSACTVSGAGENLAKGYLDGAGVVEGWMDSENLLGDWTETGVSCQLCNDGQWLCGAVYIRA
ncbi:MAG: CAP domain-containing protein [Micrococcales bacterium]|nr:CAP domain-containing protein [Micrococcales bacterium]